MSAHPLVVATLLGVVVAGPALAAGQAAPGQAYGWDFSSKAPAQKDAVTAKDTAASTDTSKHTAVAKETAVSKTTVATKAPIASAATSPRSRVSPAGQARAAGTRDLKPAGVHLVWEEPPAASHGTAPGVPSGGVVLQWSPSDAGHTSTAPVEPTAVKAVKEEEPIAPEPTAVAAASTAAPAAESVRAPMPPAAASDAPTGAEVELVPGRPGFTESRGVVSAGVAQFEGGYAFTADETDGLASRTSNVPGAVVRFGLDGRVEFRIAGAGLTRQTQTSALGRSQSVGFGDVQIGMKIMALREREAGVELGVIPMVSIPSRVSAVSSFGYDPSLTLSFGRALPKGFDATGLVRGAWLTVGGARATQYSGSVSVGHAIWNGWGGSAEMFTLSDPVTGALQWNLGTAVARQIGRRLQVDVDLGHSLNYLAPTWTFGAGFVVR